MHMLKASAVVAARMALVTSFVVAMPCWALFCACQQATESGRHASAKALLPAVVWSPGDTPFERSFVGPAASEPTQFATAAAGPTVGDEQSARILTIEARLQGLGAIYLRLTYRPAPAPASHLAPQQSCYHFLCQMPLPGDAPYCKPFEAVAQDPDAAMQIVLDQVERWLQANAME